jgi:HD-GYP domain-containing protein (c-di-GMP phosphodiesterase class II)
LLHDIGKIGVPASILDKKEPLTDDEFARIRTHPSIGARILHPIAAYQRLIPVVEQHHERFDGKGYPKGLAGEAIHPAARIMALADAFDAMVSDRPYRKGMPLGKVRGIIQEEAGRQFDPEVVAAFERVVARKFPLAIVRSDGLTDTEQAVPQKVAQGR